MTLNWGIPWSRRRLLLLLPVLVLVCVGTGVIVWWVLRPAETAVDRLRERGRLVVITQNSQHSYYIDRGEPHGFEYELAQAFAADLGVELEVATPQWSRMVPMLRDGAASVIAAAFTNTAARREEVLFSHPYMFVRQHLIVHSSKRSVRRMADMNGMTVHVRTGTSYESRLRELKAGGLQIDVSAHPERPTEDLIRAVAEQEIAATVADTHVARLNRRYYPNARIAFHISGPQPLAWAVRPGEHSLRRAINQFFERIKHDGTYERIHERYYGHTEVFDYFDIAVFHRRVQTRLPEYEAIFKQEARAFGFDWRFIAAMAYQESHYHPLATSYTGVRGIMQVTLDTAREMGIRDRLDPGQSIHAGVKYLAGLRARFDDIPTERDRLLFALAAYNVGYGHVRDAQQLAGQQGFDPRRWRSLEESLPLLAHPEYYRDLPHGYARGHEPVRYVKRILSYYDILRKLEQ